SCERMTKSAECRGRLLPGYPADFVILSQDPTRVAPLRLYDTEILATVLDGKVKYTAQGFSL
ncbi:MAG TPA: amidohydrolase family protein, partial [candidate division Zixibacteria bacterium]|nr:amidohydrolase family protein [candidate division Zixibacteria bacterium]